MTARDQFAGFGAPGLARQRVETLLSSHARDWRLLDADSWAVYPAGGPWALWRRVPGAREWAEKLADVESADHAQRLASDLRRAAS
jgi:hypothetical protein